MNCNTAAGLRAACVQVLGVFDDPDEVGLGSLNIDRPPTRSQYPNKQGLEPHISETQQA
jgi:hypothetical protein